MTEGAPAGGASGGNRNAPGARAARAKRPLSTHPEAVKARKKRLRRQLRRIEEAPVEKVAPPEPAPEKMVTTKLVESGVVRRVRAARMYEVEQFLMRGAATGTILRRICADFGVSDDQVYADINLLRPEVMRIIEASLGVDAATRRAQDREVLVDLYDRCIAEGDKATAQRVWHRVVRIDGAEAPINVNVNVRAVTDAEAEAAARELAELLGHADARIIDAKSTERADAPVRVIPAPEEMH